MLTIGHLLFNIVMTKQCVQRKICVGIVTTRDYDARHAFGVCNVLLVWQNQKISLNILSQELVYTYLVWHFPWYEEKICVCTISRTTKTWIWESDSALCREPYSESCLTNSCTDYSNICHHPGLCECVRCIKVFLELSASFSSSMKGSLSSSVATGVQLFNTKQLWDETAKI